MVLCYSSPNGSRHTYLQVQIKITSSLLDEQLQCASLHTHLTSMPLSDGRQAALLLRNCSPRAKCALQRQETLPIKSLPPAHPNAM